MTGKERITALINGEQPDSMPFMPITMMFAADVIGAAYRDYATDFRILAEGQLRTAEAFDIDYVSCISDPAREAADCGAEIKYFDDQPPAVDETRACLANKKALHTLAIPDPLSGGRMHDRVKAAALLHEKSAGDKMVEGWVEGPCAEAADLRGINALMIDFFEDPPFIHDLFEFTTELGLLFAKAQVEAGVDLIGIGDAAASLVGPKIYEDIVWPCEKRLIDGIHQLGARVRLHICGDTSPLLVHMGRLECAIVDLDSMVSLAQARRDMGPRQVLLGNIDPVRALRDVSPRDIRQALTQCLQDAQAPYIVGAGCEVPRDTPHENLHAMKDFARASG